MALLLSFAALYNYLGPIRTIVDKGVDPAVEGITVLYGKVSSVIYRVTRVNLGFVTPPPDHDFLFNVRLASYINERRASSLLDIAVDNRFSQGKRERALMALLKFETTSDWIQPFLNELPKGGLLGLYDEKTPLLDELIKKIRAEGGVRQPLVRAYAEVVFSFLLQVPDRVIRLHALRWLSDVLAEDAIFLLIPRLSKEQDPQAQLAIEKALFEVRAVSDPESAKNLLIPLYRVPPWPSVKLPIGAVLARLGHEGSIQYVRSVLQSETISKEERGVLALANDGLLYPRQLKVTEKEERLVAERRQMRREQTRVALERREQILRQERTKQTVLAKAADQSVPSVPKQESAALSPPAPFPIPGAEPETPAAPVEKAEKMASLPPDITMPPPLEEPVPRARSLMNYVDMVFETKEEVPLFQNPGEKATSTVLPAGTKGKADFEVMIGEDRWYQVKSKKGNGWANGKFLSIYNLSPDKSVPASARKPPARDEGLDGTRDESTYFEAAADEVPTFETPSEKAKKKGVLSPDAVYLAIRSEKINMDRWFLLEIRAGETAWVRGIDLRLADVQQPVKLDMAAAAPSSGSASAFAAEWVKASVKGVGVYSRPTITGKMTRQISPPSTYKVLETLAHDGKEWYRIELPDKKNGWVQTMDVNLTKPE